MKLFYASLISCKVFQSSKCTNCRWFKAFWFGVLRCCDAALWLMKCNSLQDLIHQILQSVTAFLWILLNWTRVYAAFGCWTSAFTSSMGPDRNFHSFFLQFIHLWKSWNFWQFLQSRQFVDLFDNFDFFGQFLHLWKIFTIFTFFNFFDSFDTSYNFG